MTGQSQSVPHPLEPQLLRDFERLSPEDTVGAARTRLVNMRYGVAVDASGAVLACLRADSLEGWPDDRPLGAMRDHWPMPCTLHESDAIDLGLVARFFGNRLFDHQDLVGIVLLSEDGRPTAILRRRMLLQALAGTEAGLRGRAGPEPPPNGESVIAGQSERHFMVARYGRLQLPSSVQLGIACTLSVTIDLERPPGGAQPVELKLTADDWPLPVVASLAAVRPEDFLVEGPDHGIIHVPRQEDSAALAFTLVPQSLGPKTVRVRFEQDHQFLRMAVVRTEVVPTAPGPVGEAPVDASPQLLAKGLPPDVTIYVDQIDRQTFDLSVRTSRDELGSAPRVVDRIEFPQPPAAYVEAQFAELDRKTRDGLSPAEFDDAVKRAGSNLYDTLFHNASSDLEGFKSYYWSTLYPWSEEAAAGGQPLTVQVVSSDPYIPWELLRPSRRLADGHWESDPQYFCQRFALSRWLEKAGSATSFPLRTVALVAPPSNLAWVQEEVDAIEGLGLQIRPIHDLAGLNHFLQNETADVLHFACHGRFGDADPARSTVIIGDRRLQPRDITAEYRNFARVQPLVFLNACDTARLGIGMTGLEGWAVAFLTAGTGFFIGSLWKTTDDLASQFAADFYAGLQAGANVGEAVREARSKIARPGDASFLSYSLYGNPRLRAARAVPP
jgi:hypothetical protein